MTQRSKQQMSLLTDLYVIKDKDEQKEKSLSALKSKRTACLHKKQSLLSRKEDLSSNQHLIKKDKIVKQQNVPSPIHSPLEFIHYSASDESPLVEVMVRQPSRQSETPKSPRQRSKSTVTAREPWSQLLKKQKTGKNDSVFSNFDPLRSLHFLAKELQNNLQSLLPDDKGIQDILTAMQNALKRVPPEVASTIHLQQTIELLPSSRKNSGCHGLDRDGDIVPEKLPKQTASKRVQTYSDFEKEESEKIQKLMEENTMKLEASCRHLEDIGQQLKNDKLYLETQLQNERASTEFYRKRVEDADEINRELLNKITKKGEEIRNLHCEIVNLNSKIEKAISSKTDVQHIISDLKQSNTTLDQECSKLKHQLKLCAIEKEKYLAILAVRDRQINEIKTEMTQLQQVVNEQLVELNSHAIAAMPSSSTMAGLWKVDQNKENIGDGTISSIRDEDENRENPESQDNQQNKASGYQGGDSDFFENLPVNNSTDNVRRLFAGSKADKMPDTNEIPVFFDSKYPSQTNTTIKDMFCEIKKQAFKLTDSFLDSSQ